MSKSSVLDHNVKTYLINAIDLSDYDVDADATTVDKIKMVREIFMSEVGSWRCGKVGQQKAIQEWLQGLPSALNIAFYNHDILQLAVQWDSLPENYTERQADKILDNYWNLLASKLLQLFNGYRVPKDML